MDETPGTPLDRKEKLLKKIWGSLPAIAFLLLLVLIIALGVRVKNEGARLKAEKMEGLRKSRPPVNVVVLDVSASMVRDRLNLPAIVEPWTRLDVRAEVSAMVVAVPVREGQFVTEGQIIAVLDPSDYDNSLDSLRASLDLARKSLKRTQRLFDKDLVPKISLDEITAEVQGLQAATRNAALKVQRTEIMAPIAGYINRLDAKEGLLLSVNDPVAEILDIERVKFSVGIPESDVDAVRKLSAFDLTIDALGGRKIRARKRFLAKIPGNRAHLYRLELQAKNPGLSILPGMFVRINIVKREVADAVSIPLYSVISRAEQRFIFVEKDGTAHLRMVQTGILEGWLVQVTKGLSPGERVIVVGQRSVDEGQNVNVIRTITDPEELFK